MKNVTSTQDDAMNVYGGRQTVATMPVAHIHKCKKQKMKGENL